MNEPTHDLLTSVFKNYELLQSKRAVARVLNIPESTVRRWIKTYAEEYKKYYAGFSYREPVDEVEEEFVDSKPDEDVPLSEVAIPKLHEGTKAETLHDLRSMAEANPEQVISRNYYRVHGKYSESTWSRYWGSFAEYKRQAGIVLSRQQHHLEKQIAKHASVEHYKAMTAECRSYGSRYDKPTKNKYKQAVFASDLHDKNVDPFYLEVLLDTCKRVQPDVIILGGDVVDAAEFGRFTVDPRDWDVVGRLKFVHENILAPLRKVCPDAQIDLIAGNHEQRLIRHLADATPALRAVLSDLHGFTVSKLLGLDRFEINYIAKGDLAAYTLAETHKEVKKNYKNYWDCFIVHHEPEGAALGMPGISGHHHKASVSSKYSEQYGAYNWVQSAGGHRLDCEYAHAKWQLGFVIATANTETKQTVFDSVVFSENFAVVGGKFYERKQP